jgi:hypothetical protein
MIVFKIQARVESALRGRTDTRKSEMRRALSEVSESATLHVNEGLFASRMHEFEDEGATVGGCEEKIVVVFAREGAGGGVEGVKIASDARSFGRREKRSNAGFRHHARNCNGDGVAGQMEGS